jgi:diadenosine tetraphosphate (Ap4A) HIT family hydrolase
MNKSTCLFCDFKNLKKSVLIMENDVAYARWDDFPVNPGHAEIIPKRHVASFFDLRKDELLAMHELAKTVKEIVNKKYAPDAYNLGINDGEAAGRTIHHAHLHLIPRYKGDVDNPRGGVRNIIPGKGDY